jgi:hypothetical protein
LTPAATTATGTKRYACNHDEDSEESAPKRSWTGLNVIRAIEAAIKVKDEEHVAAMEEEIKVKDEEHAAVMEDEIKRKDEDHAAAIKVKDEKLERKKILLLEGYDVADVARNEDPSS